MSKEDDTEPAQEPHGWHASHRHRNRTVVGVIGLLIRIAHIVVIVINLLCDR